ncbi:MAG: hypothetical protein WCF65_02300 [Parachlamydiaceae bacterium]
MEPRSAVFLKVLLNAYHPGPLQGLVKVLPQDQAKEVLSATASSKNPALGFTWLHQTIARTHYSWLAPIVKKLPKGIHSPLITAMPQAQSAGLQKMLNLLPFPGNLPSCAKALLLEKFYAEWQEPEAIPLDFLPSSPLSELLTLSKNELVDVIDFLSVYDLAEGIKQIVDQKKLKLIYLCLTAKKQQFLRLCLHKREKVSASKFDIEKWDGKQETLTHLLHRRGLLRFGKALNGQGRHFLWHIVHMLDAGRGQIINNYYDDHVTPGVTSLLGLQVASVIKFLKPKSST